MQLALYIYTNLTTTVLTVMKYTYLLSAYVYNTKDAPVVQISIPDALLFRSL